MPNFFKLSTANYIQNWDPAYISANDLWPANGSVVGYLGDINSSDPTNVDPRGLTSPALGAVDVVANQTNVALTNGGVIEITSGGETMVALQGSGTADAPSLVFYLDATGREDVTLSFDAVDLDNDNTGQQLNVQYRTSPTGNWINVPNGYFTDVSIAGSPRTAISVTLPAGANDAGQLEVRVMTTNASGSDDLIGIDNIVVSSEPLTVDPTAPGTLSVADAATVIEGDAGVTEVTFAVTRAEGSDGAVSADWSIVHGTTNATDFAGATSGTLTFAAGETSRTVTIQVAGDLLVEPNESFSVTLGNPQGGVTISDGTGVGSIATDDLPPVANVWINEFHYDPSSTPETGEFVEIAGQEGVDLSGYRIVLYNGNGGGIYAPAGGSSAGIPLSGILGGGANGFGFASVVAPGLQNGSPDGIALVDSFGRVVQFLSYEGVITATGGPAAGMTSTDIGRYEDQASPGTSLQLTGTGSSYADFTWTHGQANTSGNANVGQTFLSGTDQGQIRLDNARVVEGDIGQAQLVFTLHRAGGFATEATVDYSISFGTADTSDLAPGTPLSGSVTFAPGELTQTISIPVAGDVAPELNEWLYVTLGGVTGNAIIVDDSGVGTVLNDDLLPLTIMEIQGAGHWSEYEGQPVVTQGIVTAIAANGFYLQDPDGDGDAATSDAVFVYTGGAPTVAIGDGVSVTGRVSEFGSELPITEIDVTGDTRFGATRVSEDNDLPETVLVGAGGLLPPTESIDSDGLAIFNPAVDGADFWESLEGMLVSIDRPQVVANSATGFPETYVVASLGEGATGMNGSGGITISEGDFNPEMIQLDGGLLGTGYSAGHSVGDQLATVTGVINYSFAHYELLLTDVPNTTLDVTLEPETAAFAGDANYMTVATLNVENLDPSDGKYDDIAFDITHNLRLPDVIAIQEMQDNDGTGRGADLSAEQNAQNLIDAIFAESGILYDYAEIAPTENNSTGGESNGNIRNGYLYRVDRVDLVDNSLTVIEDPSFSNSRLPLVATWDFQGQQITTINVHFYARSGSDPLWGAAQPPQNSGDDRREDQAAAVGDWLNENLATDPDFTAAVLGDWNGFYFEEAQTQLSGLVNVQQHLLPEAERYSYIFEGNAQLLDNILVTENLLTGAGVDGVHINAYFGDAGTSDHDPQVARFLLGTRPSDMVLSSASVAENMAPGTVVGTVTAEDSEDDTLVYELVDDAEDRFAINAVTGVITTLMALNYEAIASAQILVRVTDAAGQSSERVFTIAVQDVNEAPVAVADLAWVDEDATTENLWASLLANDSDPDAGDSLTISAVSTSGTLGSLLFDPLTQNLRYLADHDSFDALAPGATMTDSFTYTVTDADGLSSTQRVTMTVSGQDDGVALFGSNGDDLIAGTAGEDQLTGGNGNDRLDGGDGHDLLDGGRGEDELHGGTGNDQLIGGRGNDLLFGGDGNDLFVFGAANGSDTILDFDVDLDQIQLAEGQGIRSARTTDVNGDSVSDLLIGLDQGSITILGVSSLVDINLI